MQPQLQLGLLAFKTAAWQPHSRYSASAASAPLRYWAVTSAPASVTTRLPRRSAGGRGVGSPPYTSGQTGTAVCPPLCRADTRAGQRLSPPEYLQPMPNRQALTSRFMAFPSCMLAALGAALIQYTTPRVCGASGGGGIQLPQFVPFDPNCAGLVGLQYMLDK